jgi:ABC-type antimicrobial peptide transport system permease subunit
MPAVYVPMAQLPFPDFHLLVQTARDPLAAAAVVRQRVREADPALPLGAIGAMDDLVADSVRSTRFALWLIASFGLLAVVLAASGVYAVTAFEVAQRIPEVGMRAAIGATPRDIVTLFVRENMRRSLIGIAVGVVLAVVLGRYAVSLMYGTSPTDIMTFAITVGMLTVVSLLATLLPARSAVRLEPAAALART